jgi:hypothetical protein
MEVLQRILKAKSYKKRPLDVLEPTFSNFKYPALPLWPCCKSIIKMKALYVWPDLACCYISRNRENAHNQYNAQFN